MSNKDNRENKAPAPEQVAYEAKDVVLNEEVKKEEKKVEAPKVNPREAEIKKEIEELEKQYVISRNVVEQADITAKIGKLRKELKDLKNDKPITDVYQKDVPVVLDHVTEKDTTRVPYQPQGDGKTFVTTL